MSYASWFGPGSIETIPNNTTITTVTQNGSNYATSVNLVPEVISRQQVLSTMTDEAITTFFTASNVPPGLYYAGVGYNVGTSAVDVWQPRDFFQIFVASADFLKTPTNSNASLFYKTKNTLLAPYYSGADPVGGQNGSMQGQHAGFLNLSTMQAVSFCAYMEDFSDNPTAHSVTLYDPWIQKIG